MNIINQIKSNPKLKSFVLWTITSKRNPKPRLWVRLIVNPIKHKKGHGTKIRRRTRIDVFPWNSFIIGKNTTIEDFSTINNGVGSITIGNEVRIGIGSTLIGPVTIEDGVRLAQNIVLSGLNHNYQDINTPIRLQGVSTSPIKIGEGTWIGANSVVSAGVKIGKNCVIGAGSIVTKNIPSFSVAVGNPAKVVKQFDRETKTWISINK